MWLGILGPLIIRSDSPDDTGRPVPTGKQRVVLAALLARANRVVSVAELAELIWDTDPPPSATATIRNYVKRLRDSLPDEVGARILTRGQGYEITVTDDELDVLRFARLYRDAESAVRSDAWRDAVALLDQALRLWRGEPMGDVASEGLRRDDGPRWQEMHLQAWEWRADAALRLGRPGDVVTDLRRLVREHPLRERFHAQLVLALHDAGSRGDAIAAYHAARHVLVEELGVEPGWQLQDLYQRVLSSDRRAAESTVDTPEDAEIAARPDVVARQLPAGVFHFVGRAAELKRLSELADRATDTDVAGTVAIAIVDGTAGVGKTALALHWAHQVADRFPDGQLYLNLRGFDPTGRPVAPAEAFGEFLDGLHVPPEAIPASVEAQASLYRSLLAGTRTLVVLDNARDVEQVRPLLPGSPRCLVLITSRNQLTGLVALEGAHPVTLDVLSNAEAWELLNRRLGAERTAGEPVATAALIDLCARLPLALSIAAARAATQPLSLSSLNDGLRNQRTRLDVLDAGDTASSTRAVFSWSYQNLSDAAARLFRLLGVHPGPDISVAATASLAGVPPARARELLTELTRGRLLTEHLPGRFACHDLLRTYAMELGRDNDSAAGRRAALGRALDHYLHSGNRAALLLDPARRPLTLSDVAPGVTVEELDDYRQAWEWFDNEHPALLAIIELAAGEFDSHVWQLSWVLKDFFTRRGCRLDRLDVCHAASRAAQRLGDVDAQMLCNRNLAHWYGDVGDYEQAYTYYMAALALHEQLDDPIDEARTHLSINWVLGRQNRHELALEHAQRAYELCGDHKAARAHSLNALAWSQAHLEQYDDAVRYCAQALALQRELGDQGSEADALDTLGYTQHRRGDHPAAIAAYAQAVQLYRDIGEDYYQARTIGRLGDVHSDAGDLEAADDAWRESLRALEALQHPDAGAAREKLRVSRVRRLSR